MTRCKTCKKVTKNSQYCSQGCHFDNHRRVSVCPICGKKRILQKRIPRKDYCSYRCANIAHTKQPLFACSVCGNKKRCVIGKANKYCSRLCADRGRRLPKEELKKRARERVNRYRRTHPEKTIAWKHKRRALEMGADGQFSSEEWVLLKKKHGNRCALCRNDKKLTVDHIIPLCKGGTNYIENIQPLCMPCNSKKWIKI